MDNVINFIKNNSNYYEEYLNNDRLKKCQYGYTSDIDQIYIYLNEIDVHKTEYYYFYSKIINNFNLNNQRILDVPCGKIPVLSKIIKDNFPNCIVNAINKEIVASYDNINTFELTIDNAYNICNYDLIISFRPCELTETIVDLCIKYKKSFILYFCPCLLQSLNSNKKFKTPREYQNFIINKIKSSGIFIIKSFYIKAIDKMPCIFCITK